METHYITVTTESRFNFGSFSRFLSTNREDTLQRLILTIRQGKPLAQPKISGLMDEDPLSASIVLDQKTYEEIWNTLHKRPNVRFCVRVDAGTVQSVALDD